MTRTFLYKSINSDSVFIGSPYLRSKKNSSIIVGGVFRCAVQVVGAARFYCNEIDFQNGKFSSFVQIEINDSSLLSGATEKKCFFHRKKQDLTGVHLVCYVDGHDRLCTKLG